MALSPVEVWTCSPTMWTPSSTAVSKASLAWPAAWSLHRGGDAEQCRSPSTGGPWTTCSGPSLSWRQPALADDQPPAPPGGSRQTAYQPRSESAPDGPAHRACRGAWRAHFKAGGLPLCVTRSPGRPCVISLVGPKTRARGVGISTAALLRPLGVWPGRRRSLISQLDRALRLGRGNGVHLHCQAPYPHGAWGGAELLASRIEPRCASAPPVAGRDLL